MTPFLWVVALALLVVRISDAHVHLCFDGQEAPSSLHVSDRSALCHMPDGSSRTHQDQDVDALGAALAKKDSQAHSVDPLPIANIVLLLLAPPRSSVVRDAAPADLTVNRPYLNLPLLRGPPA
jgi:hypothetical protein